MPSLSLFKKVCYQDNIRGIATESGGKDDFATEICHKIVKKYDQGIVIERSGLLILPEYSNVAASPDTVIRCLRYRVGWVEMKCLLKCKDLKIDSIAQRKS